MKQRMAASAVYATGHFFVDFSCALTMLSLDAAPWQFLLYNFLAFAVQMPLGLLADLCGRNRGFAIIGASLVTLGFLPSPVLFKVISIGLGNACYHVGGGREALLDRKGLTGLGVFVSPGAAGILLGTLFHAVKWIHIFAGVGLVICMILVLSICSADRCIRPKRKPNGFLAGIMLTIVLSRSLVGLCMATPWKIGIYIVLAGFASAFGKASGGILADRFGWKQTGAISLILSALLFLIPDHGISGVLGVFLFNMTMPITLGLAADACPGLEGFSFGLLTFGLFLGYLPSAFGLTIPPIVGTGMALISAGLLTLTPEGRHD